MPYQYTPEDDDLFNGVLPAEFQDRPEPETPPEEDIRDTERFEDRARGLMLGLLLGDAYDEWTSSGATVHGTCLGQLACFTLEGAIRASVRFAHKGICSPPAVIWHAWCRWGHIQGIDGEYREKWLSTGSRGSAWG